MRKEYALRGVGYFRYWSDAYPTLGLARRAGKDVIRGTAKELHILQRVPLPPGHEIGARWRTVGIVTGSPTRAREFARICARENLREQLNIEAAERGFVHGSREWEDWIEKREAELLPE